MSEIPTKTEQAKSRKVKTKPETKVLKGTLISVFALLGFIVLSWFGIYALYISR